MIPIVVPVFWFHLEAGLLSDVLVSWADQCDCDVMFDFNALRTRTLPHLDGRMSAQAALDLLLAGSGLTYSVVGEIGLAVSVEAIPDCNPALGAASPVPPCRPPVSR